MTIEFGAGAFALTIYLGAVFVFSLLARSRGHYGLPWCLLSLVITPFLAWPLLARREETARDAIGLSLQALKSSVWPSA